MHLLIGFHDIIRAPTLGNIHVYDFSKDIFPVYSLKLLFHIISLHFFLTQSVDLTITHTP